MQTFAVLCVSFLPSAPFQSFLRVRRRGVLVTLVLLCILGPAFAQGRSAASGQAPIKIALIEGLSGAFANTGEAVFRNLLWATERVNARGGVKLPGGSRTLALARYDSKGQNEKALSALRSAIDDGVTDIALEGEGSGYGFRVVRTLTAAKPTLPISCAMQRPVTC
jgi:ABC-type sugar transport system substrate-binding protein